MLYDPKWKVEVKADPFSLAGLIAWLEKQPSRVEYCYTSNGQCLLGQYFTAMGFEGVSVDSEKFSHEGAAGDTYFPSSFDYTAIGHPRTFGGALNRARALAAQS